MKAFVSLALASLLLLEANSVSAVEQKFCVLTETTTVNARVLIQNTRTREDARIEAENGVCERTCGSICAAIDFSDKVCGSEQEMTFNLFGAQSKVFCENSDGSPAVNPEAVGDLRLAVAPDYPGSGADVAAIVEASNRIMKNNKCPLTLKSQGAASILPEVFRGLAIKDAGEVKAFAQYPGTFKFVRKIDFCADNPSTATLSEDGKDVIKECTVTSYSSTLLSTSSIQYPAILLLRGYAHLAGVEQSRSSDLQYTLADPELFIPKSPLLEGKPQAFHVTKPQCIALIRHARKDATINSFKR